MIFCHIQKHPYRRLGRIFFCHIWMHPHCRLGRIRLFSPPDRLGFLDFNEKSTFSFSFSFSSFQQIEEKSREEKRREQKTSWNRSEQSKTEAKRTERLTDSKTYSQEMYKDKWQRQTEETGRQTKQVTECRDK